MLATLLASVAVAGLPPAPTIQVPPGYRAEVYATGLRRPTALAWGPRRLLYATQETGQVVAVRRGTTRPRVVVTGFRTPLGLAWIGRTLFVSSRGKLERMQVGRRAVWGRRAIVRGLLYGRHQQNNVIVGHDGRLWFGSGSTCDVCRERDRRSAAILSVRPDGSGLRIESRGLRNPYGLYPIPGGVIVTVNGRDDLGDGEPAETIVYATRGRFFGWPRCWPSHRRRALVGSCRGVMQPIAYLEPHSSANGIVQGALGSEDYFVALWGQYRSHEHGRYVARVDPKGLRPVKRFATGFDHPLAVIAERTGALLVADWGRGVIYRITTVPRGSEG